MLYCLGLALWNFFNFYQNYTSRPIYLTSICRSFQSSFFLYLRVWWWKSEVKTRTETWWRQKMPKEILGDADAVCAAVLILPHLIVCIRFTAHILLVSVPTDHVYDIWSSTCVTPASGGPTRFVKTIRQSHVFELDTLPRQAQSFQLDTSTKTTEHTERYTMHPKRSSQARLASNPDTRRH